MNNVFVPKDYAADIEALIKRDRGSSSWWRELARLDDGVHMVIDGEPSLRKVYEAFTSANLDIPGSKIKPIDWEAWEVAARGMVDALKRVKRRQIPLCQRKILPNSKAICGQGLKADGSCPRTDRNDHLD